VILSKYTDDIDSLPERQKKFENQEREIAENEDRIRELEITVKTMMRADKKTEEEYNSRCKELYREVEKQKDSLERDKAEFVKEKTDMIKRIKDEEASKKVTEVNGLKDKIKRLENEKRKAEQKGEKLRGENETLKKDAEQRRAALSECTENLDTCEREKKMHAGNCRELEARVKELEEEFIIVSKPTKY
jgi:chromosome segregation ATPase